jgi:TPR repeat protein
MLLYCRADADGHANSAYAIGLLYAGGHGFKQDQARASAWFKRVAALGHPEGTSMAKIFRQRGKRGSARCPQIWARPQTGTGRHPGRNRLSDRRGIVGQRAGTVAAYPGHRDPVRRARRIQPNQNIQGGMRYLRWLLKHFKGDVTKTVAAYNAGEGAVKKYGGIPPYRETQNYVRKIRRLYTKLRHPV